MSKCRWSECVHICRIESTASTCMSWAGDTCVCRVYVNDVCVCTLGRVCEFVTKRKHNIHNFKFSALHLLTWITLFFLVCLCVVVMTITLWTKCDVVQRRRRCHHHVNFVLEFSMPHWTVPTAVDGILFKSHQIQITAMFSLFRFSGIASAKRTKQFNWWKQRRN